MERDPASPPAKPAAKRTRLEIRARDGNPLAATWFTPHGPAPHGAVVVIPGGGVSARIYARLADALADRGFAVLTFDCRGVGDSRRGSLRGLIAGVEHWGALDTEAALAIAQDAYPGAPPWVVAHSIGCLYWGAAASAPRASRVVFLSPHTGYWGDYAPVYRWPLFGIFHVLMPVLTACFGYFPARALGLGNDLPRRFAQQWAGRLRPELLASAQAVARFGSMLDDFGHVRAQVLALRMCDDPFASLAGTERLCGQYVNATVRLVPVTGSDLGVERAGHFAFRTPRAAAYLADMMTAWFLLDDRLERTGTARDFAEGACRG